MLLHSETFVNSLAYLQPGNVLAFALTGNENEAHFTCVVLNSSVVDLSIRSIAGGTKNFGMAKIIENTVRIPKFDASDEKKN